MRIKLSTAIVVLFCTSTSHLRELFMASRPASTMHGSRWITGCATIASIRLIPATALGKASPGDETVRGTTVGCEFEWSDISLDVELPKGYGRDIKDYTIVNSNGIANDPSGKLYRFGGEINTPPTETAGGQAECLQELLTIMPNAKINYRSNLHVHVRWPGLKNDLEALKRVQRYIHETMPRVFPIVEPIPQPTLLDYPGKTDEYRGAVRRYKRRKVSHHTLLHPTRLERQLAAFTIEEFFKLEVPQSQGVTAKSRPMWHMQPRLCVNLRQLLQTDTVEFRHFPGTLDPVKLRACIDWCVCYLTAAIENVNIEEILYQIDKDCFPKFPEYCHWQESRYRATCHDGTLPKEVIVRNIKAIEAGTFDVKGKVPL